MRREAGVNIITKWEERRPAENIKDLLLVGRWAIQE
jgi:hypothetical protein